jgi:hypothetical protein
MKIRRKLTPQRRIISRQLPVISCKQNRWSKKWEIDLFWASCWQKIRKNRNWEESTRYLQGTRSKPQRILIFPGNNKLPRTRWNRTIYIRTYLIGKMRKITEIGEWYTYFGSCLVQRIQGWLWSHITNYGTIFASTWTITWCHIGFECIQIFYFR